MALLDDLEDDISDVLSASWDLRDGEVVPSTENVALSGGGVKIAATLLYADLAESTALAMWDDGWRRVFARPSWLLHPALSGRRTVTYGASMATG
jgi:hypothetical protein